MATKTCVLAFAIGLFVMGAAVWAAVPAASQESAAPVTFHKDVLPILQKNCQTCHRPGQIGPMPLLTYKESRPWAKAIKPAVALRKMPPWPADPQYGHFVNDRSLKQAEIDTIVKWVDNGSPEGDPKDGPPPVQWPAGGWSIQPDMVFDLPPYEVPAKGVKEWESIAFPVPFKEDTWVTSIEILPGEPAVTHHLCFGFEPHRSTTVYNRYEWMEVERDESGASVTKGSAFFQPDGAVHAIREGGSTEVKRNRDRMTIREGEGHFCFLPGTPPEDFRPWDAGVFVPAGSDIVVNLHYTPNGKTLMDKSRIGFTIAKVPPSKMFTRLPGGGVLAAAPENVPITRPQLAIPPYEGNYLAPVQIMTFPKDAELISFRPHAHVRGKSAKYTLIYPDGREEIVLYVPQYDFNWQLTYKTSLKIPKGARLKLEWRYDNSVNNKYNPDPGRWVYYGDQSWEEMSSGNTAFIIDRPKDPVGYSR